MLSSNVLNLSKVLKTYDLQTSSAVAYSVAGNTLSVNTVYANQLRSTGSNSVTIGTSDKAIDLTGSGVVLDAPTININAQTFIVDSTNMLVTDNNINVNRGKTALSGAGITIMSGLSTESAKLVIDSANGWLFTSPGNVVDVRELSAGTISTLNLSTGLLSAAGLNLTDRLVVQGNLSATSATLVNLSVASLLRSDRLDATTMFASNVSIGTLVSNTTLSVGTLALSMLSTPAVSLSQTIVDVQVNASLLSVQNMSLVRTNDSTVIGIISNLYASQIAHPAVGFPQPMLGMPSMYTSLVHVFCPAFEINTGGGSFRILSNISSGGLAAGTVQMTSDLALRFVSGISATTAVSSLNLFSPAGATVAIRYRTGMSTLPVGQLVCEFGENINNAVGTVQMYTNGYFKFSSPGSRWGFIGDEPGARTTMPVSDTHRIAVITFGPSATGLTPIVKTYDNSGALRYTTTVSASLSTADIGFRMLPNQDTVPMSLDVTAIAFFRTEITAGDMPELYRLMGQLQFGGVHMAAGTSFISTLSATAMNIGTLIDTNLAVTWPAISKKVNAYRTNISTLNVTFGINTGFSPGIGGTTISTISGISTISMIETNTTGSILGFTGVSTFISGIAGSAFQIATPTFYVNSQLNVSYLSVRDQVYFNTTPATQNVSVQTHTYTVSLSTKNMSVASFYAPSVSVATTFGTPTTYTSTGFVSATANTLNTTSTLYMSTLRFNTPTGLGPTIRMDYGNGACTNGTVTVTFAANMFSSPPTVFVTPMVVSGDVTEIHTTSVLSTQFEVRANLSAGGTPAQTRFCWIAVGV